MEKSKLIIEIDKLLEHLEDNGPSNYLWREIVSIRHEMKNEFHELRMYHKIKNLETGDVVYDSGSYGDLFEVEVVSIDLENNTITGKDKSQDGKIVELAYFLSVEEVNEISNNN